jgi:LysM repeat protein
MFSKLAFATTAALALLSPVLADCTRNYTVVAGDICDSISKAHNVSTYQLAAVNVGVIDPTCSNLEPGENLCLGTTGEDCTATHVVQDQDSCDSLLAQYNVNATILSQNNPNIDGDCDNLYTGEVLCVSPTVVAPPIPSGFFDNGNSTIEWIPVPAGDGNEDLPYCDDVDN